MKKQKKMTLLFNETFSSHTNSLPGGWYVERNHDMPQVPGIQCGEKCIELLSAGKGNISPLMDQAMSDLMLSFSRTGISVNGGHLIACRTKDHGVMVIVSNPGSEEELVAEITIRKQPGMNGIPEVSREDLLMRKDRDSRTFRVLLPQQDLVTMFFKEGQKK